MREVNIVYICDNDFIVPTITSVNSLKAYREKSVKYNVYIIVSSSSIIEERLYKDISEPFFRVVFLDAEGIENENTEKLINVPDVSAKYVTKAALFKFLLADILDDIDKVLYIDGDTIIQSSLCNLFDIDISEKYVAAVPDMGCYYPDLIDHTGRLNFGNEFYFNSGVMLLNLSKMREDNVSKALVDYRMNYKNNYMDQDALNYVLGKSAYRLPIEYNTLTLTVLNKSQDELIELFSINTIEELLDRSKILHTAGALKPWIYNIPWVTERFYKYCPESGLDIFPVQKLKSPFYLYKKESSADRKDWAFPYSLIPKGSRVVLYGCGIVGETLKKQNDYTGYCNIVAWADKRSSVSGEGIIKPESICDKKYDLILIAVADRKKQETIKNELISLGNNEDTIVVLP